MIDKLRKILFFTFILVTLVLAISLCTSLFLTPNVQAVETRSAEYDGYIVKLKDDVSTKVSLLSNDVAKIGDGYYVVDSIDDAEKLADQSDIEFIEPNYIVKLFDYPADTNDYLYPDQSTYLNLINASSAWSKGYDGDGVTVAVIDSGLVNGHEDINYANVLTGTYYYLSESSVVEYSGSTYTNDVTGHGSFVTGVIAAQINNTKGIAGITDEVNILPLKCFVGNETTDAQILAAIQDAIDAHVDVINMSFGSEYYSQAEESILQEAANDGIILVAAAGNEGDDIDKYGVYNYPAAYDCVISVGSVDPSGNISYFSQVNDSVWVAAPGEFIISLGYEAAIDYYEGGGTSFAAPFVSALAAIAKQYDEDIDVYDMKELLKDSAVDAGPEGKDILYGYGIINVADLIYALEHEQSYNIIYQLDDGSLAAGYVSSFKTWDTPVTLPEPTKEGFNFGGWYTDAGFTGSIVTAIPQGTSNDYTVYARWYDDEETTVSGITVKGYAATLNPETNDTYEVTIPEGTTISASDIAVTTAYQTASVSTATTSDSGATWDFTVTSGSIPLNHKHYRINVTVDYRPTPVIATRTGTATPASYNGGIAAIPYSVNVLSWFFDQEGDALTFALVSDTAEGSVSLNDGFLEYTPSVNDTGKDITIVVKANDGKFDSSSNVTVTVSVSDIPGSDNMLSTTTATFDKLTSSSDYRDISLEIALGNTLSSIENNGTELDTSDYTVSNTNVTITKEYLAGLANGNYILIFTFGNGYHASMAVTVDDSTIAVTNITLAYSKVAPGGQLTLSGTIAPTDASNKTIVWSLKDAGTTGASVEGGNFSATANGTAIVTATITNGISAGTDYVKDFTITVSSVAVTNITIAKSSVIAGSKLTLLGTVVPANATYTTIVWSLKDPDTTGATLVGNTLSTTTAGTATVTATIADGVSVGTDYVKDFTITVSSGGGGGGGGGGSMEVVEDSDYVKLICGNQAFEIPYTIEGDQAVVDIDDDTLDELIDSANQSGIISIDFSDVDIEAVTLPYDAFADITKAGIGGLTLRLPTATIDISAEAMTGIVEQAKGKDITFSAEQINKSTLTNTQRQVVGDNPVYGLSVKCGSTSVSEFNGNVTISMPYELKSGQDAGGVVIWYLDSAGKLTEVPCTYDKTTKTVTFTVTHFSYYVISYDQSKITENMFSDVDKDAWYYDAVIFCSKNGITKGTGDGKFSPDALLTRGQFLVMLMRAYGLEAAESASDNFADAGNTYYTGYLAAAKKLGIASGVGDNMFAPDSQITRQDMCVLLYRVLNILDKLPELSTGTSLTTYSDYDAIADYAQDAMKAFVADGVIKGNNGQLNPQGISTRAQMAQVLYNLLYVQ